MSYRLLDRQKQIPNGLKYRQAETNWEPPRYASFMTIVNGLISHRKSNPHLIAQKKWSTDIATVSEEVDAYNALLCARHGWTDYISDGGSSYAPPPKSQALLQQEKSVIAVAVDKAKKIWSGIKTIDDWIDSGTPPVPQDKANARAAICAACPKNGKGDFTEMFTKVAADVIKKQIEKLNFLKLTTPSSDKLNICTVCACPLKLKIHAPLQHIKEHMSPAVLSDLRAVPNCWIVAELNS